MRYCPTCGAPLRDREVGGALRRVCMAPGCRFVHWDNPVPVVAALVELNGEIVLARNAAWPAGIFSVVTGYLEKNESPEQAVMREVNEELGVAAHNATFLGHFPFSRKNQLILAYHVAAAGKLSLGDEIVETRTVVPDQVDALPVVDPAELGAARRSHKSEANNPDADVRILPLTVWCWSQFEAGGGIQKK